jgi:hypothetical protein
MTGIILRGARHWYKFYSDCKIVVEKGVDVADLDARAPRIRAMLDTQGWPEMVRDHRPAIKELVHKFYTNIHKKRNDSF